MMSNAAPAALAMKHGLKGECFGTVSACAAGAHAIGSAARMIVTGEADAVVCGGSEAAHTPLAQAAFAAMDALSKTGISRPFDARRDGFVMGEGAGVLVLEDAERAEARGATILGDLLGYGSTADAHHLTAPEPRGEGAARAIAVALATRPRRTQVDYVNAHGTTTDSRSTTARRPSRSSGAGYRPRGPRVVHQSRGHRPPARRGRRGGGASSPVSPAGPVARRPWATRTRRGARPRLRARGAVAALNGHPPSPCRTRSASADHNASCAGRLMSIAVHPSAPDRGLAPARPASASTRCANRARCNLIRSEVTSRRMGGPRPARRRGRRRRRAGRGPAGVLLRPGSSYAGGSLGEAHADTVVRVLRLADRAQAPVVGFIASAGARMQEGLARARRLRAHLRRARAALRPGAADLRHRGDERGRRLLLAGRSPTSSS
jgi:hypothetical protein